MSTPTIKGYKIFNPDFTCRDFKYAEHTEYKMDGMPVVCQTGFHFCVKASHCFSYYDFDPKNIICEVEALGETSTEEKDSKVSTNHIRIGRRLTWSEVLIVANEGTNNAGHSNSGHRNSGHSNSGNSNSGHRNSGHRNSGNRNSGDWNSGNSNSGNWNSGNRNSGDSNSGYRNAGAFCINDNPELILFDKPSGISVIDWEKSRAVELMYNVIPTIWVQGSVMTDKEKSDNPKWETADGFLKTITMKEAWANAWHNLDEVSREVFTTLPNFDATIFEHITGIKVTVWFPDKFH